jgi:hypothetical protein
MNHQSSFRSLVINWEGVRHPILSDLSRSSRLSLAKYPYRVNALTCLHQNVQVVVKSISCEFYVIVISMTSN